MADKKIGLALGSGGLRGFAMFPIIKRLEEEEISNTAVSGSSIGALIGAYYALHGEINTLFEISSGLTRTDYLKMADPNKPTKSLFKGEKLMMSRLSRPVKDGRVFDLTLKFSPDLANALSPEKWKEHTSIGQKAIDQNISKIQAWLEK